ncbi:sulfurtransferase TusA family protein [Texcoconibacillus texcoconensis]|uniref:Rhodanese-related sulfurtransferase/TusA-related sulfurtransferase n=1 Tax=Texcoconibacillus texcoconensis TaxID=1095777 RepID=A0A840QR37_9BACI|nr:sulfurtransferase TusA family protein [Texcoconibacillus texcoconensis]MBB5173798.1 rhodanese-related sulfurtransferase/TusA-related sulfurtransferase [Texcoconibacillus texcoconensis]
MTINVNLQVDAKGLACPMPIVKTKKAIDQIEAGEVLEIEATDRGSLADMKGWADSTGHQYIGTKEEGELLIHYIRKADPSETKEVTAFEPEIDNDQLKEALNDEETLVVDVREPAEYAFGHIPGAVSIPLEDLEERMKELDVAKTINVVCRTGNRSSMAAQKLADRGFSKVQNVVPGMSQWDGDIQSK